MLSHGGIAGYLVSGKIDNCHSKNIIIQTGGNYGGGIIGYAAGTIIKCTNSGTVIGIADNQGGIVGKISTSITVIECYNSGKIRGKVCVGGIVGDCYSGYGQDISLCHNSGEVKGTDYVGGISGYLGAVNSDPKAKEDKCYNKGRVINTESTEKIGGIAGSIVADANVTNCYFLSGIGVNKGIGGTGDYVDAQNAGAIATNVDLKSYEEFITWIEEQ